MVSLRKRKRGEDKPWFGKKGRFKKGLTAPGHNYMGPGNPMDNGKTMNMNDWVSRTHDEEYGRIELITGKDPMKYWVKADQDFLDNTNWGGWGKVAKVYFHGKKLAAKAGLIETLKYAELRKRKGEPLIQNAAKKSKLITKLAVKTAAEMSDGSGSGNNGGITETPVDAVTHVSRGPPDYTFASLPFFMEQWNNQTNVSQDWAWRMTSPYDCYVTTATSDSNVGAGSSTEVKPVADGSDSTITKARWWDFYASIYKYYHVESCRYKVYIENMGEEPIYCHRMFYNDQLPPTNATNTDMKCWHGVQTQVLESKAIAIAASGSLEANHKNYDTVMDEGAAGAGQSTNFEDGNMIANEIGKKACVFAGEYSPGDFDRQIRLDANVENWTTVTTNPTLQERLLLRIKPYWESFSLSDATTRDRTLNYKLTIELNYLVEFKELKDGLKYPVNDQPYVATITNTN